MQTENPRMVRDRLARTKQWLFVNSRLVIGALLCANLGVAGLFLLSHKPRPSTQPVSADVLEGLEIVLLSELEVPADDVLEDRHLNEEVIPTGSVATPAPSARECRVWGPRATADEFSEVERQLAEEGGFPEIRATEVRASPVYLVYIDVLDSRTQARRIAQELKTINIDNLWMRRDSGVIVSVGVFSRRLLADRQLSRMQELGYEAKLEEMPRQQTVYKLYGYVKPDAPVYAQSSSSCDYDASFEVSAS
ncbi:MAG: hypothetical protein VYE04_15470 [Pseudomonadota bacterium]|nr:hypothetical protein [Pseudomonadota bacterium]